MIFPTKETNPDLQALLALFPSANDIAACELVPAACVPDPYRDLLVHEHHMTVTVETHHGSLVNVRVLNHRQDDDLYARKILLALQNNGRVVQYGIMRIHLHYCSQPVRAAIVAAQTPLGRILIEHDVLRRIEPTGFLRIIPGSAMMEWFALPSPQPTYGRLAYIHCNEKPAVELLEIVLPE